MHVWEDKYKREGLIGTIVFHVILLLIFIFAGLPYTVPRPEQGILVNFGTSNHKSLCAAKPAAVGFYEEQCLGSCKRTSCFW